MQSGSSTKKETGKQKSSRRTKTKLGQEELKIIADTTQQKKAIQDKMQEQIKGLEQAAEKRLACKRDEKIALKKDLLDLAEDISERRAVLVGKAAAVASELAHVRKPADATMISVAPRNIVHSNHVKAEEMLAAALSDPELQKAGGISAEQAGTFIQFSLTYMKSVSMEVTASPQAAPSQPVDLRTVNGQEEAAAAPAAAASAEARRKAAGDEEWTSEDLDQEEKDREDPNRKLGDKPVTRRRVKRRHKKSQTG